jgi:hypothetical protein
MFTKGLRSCMRKRDAVSGIKICYAKDKIQQRHAAVTAHQWENNIKFWTIYMHACTDTHPRPHTGCTNPRCRVTASTKFCMVAPNICGPWVWNLLHITLLAPRILRWLIDFWKICELLPEHTHVVLPNHSSCNNFCFKNMVIKEVCKGSILKSEATFPCDKCTNNCACTKSQMNKLHTVSMTRLFCEHLYLLLIPCIFLQLTHQPTYALNKIQFVTTIKLLHVSAPGCHPQGVY